MANNKFIRNIKIEADANGGTPSTLQLLTAGVWNTPWHGDFELTPNDIDQFVSNYQANIGLPSESEGKIQVNYGHASWDKAAGWMSNLRAEDIDGRYSLVADVEWTEEASTAIKAGEWRYISPEFNPRALPWEDPEEEWRMVANVLTGAGLTNIPLFKKLKKVAASERPDSKQSNQGEPMTFKLEEVRTLEASAINADQREFLKDNKAELTDDELKKFDIKADEKPNDKPTVQANATTVSINADELAQLRANAQQGVEAAQKLSQKEASDFADARIEAGQIKSDQAKELVTILTASSAEDRATLERFIEGLPSNPRIAGDELGDGGKTDSTASDELAQKAEKIVADTNGSTRYGDAVKQVLASNKDLRARVEAERK